MMTLASTEHKSMKYKLLYEFPGYINILPDYLLHISNAQSLYRLSQVRILSLAFAI